MSGKNNIGMGTGIYRSLRVNAQFTGEYNTGIGSSVFILRDGDFLGTKNIGIGTTLYTSPNGHLSGHRNIGMGDGTFTFSGSFSGNDNIGIGTKVMNASQGIAGDYNIALGYESMTTSSGKIAGTNNIAIGYRAIWPVNTDIGSYNIGIGNWALNGGMAKGNANIQIGNWDVGPLVAGQLNRVVAIGNEMTGLDTTNTDNNVILLGRNSLSGARVGVGTYQPKARLDVAGSIKVGNDGSTCTSDNVGTIRFVGNHFYGCDGTTWKQLDN